MRGRENSQFFQKYLKLIAETMVFLGPYAAIRVMGGSTYITFSNFYIFIQVVINFTVLHKLLYWK